MADLQNKLKAAREQIQVGQKYAHYRSKDKAYLVLQIALLEAEVEPCVVYQDLHDLNLIWVRPLKSFCETVEASGKMVPRFQKI
jgi:hypothetical protein